ncbi:Pkinase-domain-containing protein [Lichtheimia hyalospora FSU 10163]|nr:Pkinase-domain-containing protein [Lichtheimia hyalospora FSU 10163]
MGMAVDPKLNVNLHSVDRAHWPIEDVVYWLENQGWGSLSRTFKDLNIHGQHFLNLSVSDLDELLQRSLPMPELLRLHKEIRALNNSDHIQITGMQHTGFNNKSTCRSTAPQPPPPTTTTTTSTSSRPVIIQTNNDYALIQPFIPERTSSNPQQISKIVNALNYDMSQIRPLYKNRLRSQPSREFINGRPRAPSNPLATAPPFATSSSKISVLDRPNPPPSPLPKTEEGWKIAGKRVQQFQEQRQQQQLKQQPPPPLPLTSQQPPYTPYHPPLPPMPSTPRFGSRRIQVTSDSNTFLGLTVTDLNEPKEIKSAILKMLNLPDDQYLYYHDNGVTYYHENGEKFYAPLTEEELVAICRNADERPTEQILVMSIRQAMPPYAKDHRGIYPDIPSNYGCNVQYQRSYCAPYMTRPDIHYPSIFGDPLQRSPISATPPQNTTQFGYATNAAAKPIRPTGRRASSGELMTVYETTAGDSYIQQYHQHNKMMEEKPCPIVVPSTSNNGPYTNENIHPEPPIQRPQASVSSDPKTKKRWLHRRQYSTDELSTLSKTRRPAVHFARQEDTHTNDRRRHLQIQIPTQSSSRGSGGTLVPSSPMPTTNSEGEEQVWGERPSIEQLYRDIDKYLPGHDLDKEIFIETPTSPKTPSTAATTATPPPPPSPAIPVAASAPTPPLTSTPSPRHQRLQAHRKSIRVVAKEAHKNWRFSQHMGTPRSILRRRSTKMWDRKVEQVKPGMIVERQSMVVKEEVEPVGYPAPTKMQWVRGELIGRGSFGRVYHALNVAAGEWIAVKEVDAPKTKSDMQNTKMREAVDSLYREISLLKDFDHENIVQYLGYDFDEDEGHIYIFLEYVPGGSILSALKKNGPFDQVLVRFLTRQILLGLEYLHDRNIMHRDIKASNILVDNHGVCKITDFGLSKPSGQEEAYDPNSNTLMKGTVFWMAPEVVQNSKYSAKIDIWSLGCTVIEMLTGDHPWMEMNMLAALYSLGKYKSPPIPEDAPDLAKDFLNQCFIIDPEARPTAADLLVHPFVRQVTNFNFQDYVKTRLN